LLVTGGFESGLGGNSLTSTPAGQRLWKCPDCGADVLLPITRLDPLACDACLAKLKGSGSPSTSAAGAGSISPEILKLLAVVLATLGIGLVIGFIAGRWTASPQVIVRPTRPDNDRPESSSGAEAVVDEAPDESTRPGPDYKWVRGYTRKDGVKVKGHWAKDPNADAPGKKPKKR
jgi:hypothetical protein